MPKGRPESWLNFRRIFYPDALDAGRLCNQSKVRAIP